MNAASRAVSASALAALVLAAVWLLWPTALGGATTYVTTQGASMEPGFHTGDLAVLRSVDRPAVGDVVAYRARSLDAVVMHRIAAVDGDRFVMKGDSNDWIDEDRPAADQVLGEVFLRVPQGGRVLAVLRSPVVLALLAVGALLVVGARHRPRGRHRAGARLVRPSVFSMPTRAHARQVAVTSGAVAVLALVGGLVLFATPADRTVAQEQQVTQQGLFSYSGAAVPGTTYPTGVIATGDTIWTRLASGLTVSFADTISGTELADLAGTIRLDVSLTASDGWSAVLPSGPVAPLANGTTTASVGVDAIAATALLGRHNAEIGSTATTAVVTVTPAVDVTGSAAGTPFRAASPSGLAFSLDASSLRLAGDPDAVLAPTTRTAVAGEQVVPRRLGLLGFSVPIDVARGAAVAVLVVALVGLAVGGSIGRTASGDVADEFLLRHAHRILPVTAFDPGTTVIDVAGPAALHRVAERFDTLVLHQAGEDADVFAVRDVETTYRFVVPGGRERRANPPVPVPVRIPAPAAPPVLDDLTRPLPVIVPETRGLLGLFA